MNKLLWQTLIVMLTVYSLGASESAAAKAEDISVNKPLVSQPVPVASLGKESKGSAEQGGENKIVIGASNPTVEERGDRKQEAGHKATPEVLNSPKTLTLASQKLEAAPDLDKGTELQDTGAESSPMDQVTSVSQLRDVQPTDWAFQALQSLVERYGCIAGYPDSTFRGNRALTRYEFAAGLNACLNRVNELIASATSGLVRKEDIVTLRRLQEDFTAELASLRGRVDVVEAQVGRLEAHQFSTTTKLSGQVITYLGDAFGNKADSVNSATFGYQTYLSLVSSFTGQDTLTVALEAGNLHRYSTAIQFPTANPPRPSVNAGTTDEARFLVSGTETYGFADNTVILSQLEYTFPVNKQLTAFVDAFSGSRSYSAPITDLNNYTNGALSFYGRVNPLFYPSYQQSAVGVDWHPASWVDIGLSFGSDFAANNPNRRTIDGNRNSSGGGLFNGGYTAAIEPIFNFGRLRLSASYLNTYSPSGGINTSSGSNASQVLGAGPVVANTYLVGGFYRFTPTFELGGSVGYSAARALGRGTKGDADVSDYRVNFLFHDLGKPGNLAGLIFGTQPRLVGTSNDTLAQAIGLPAGQRHDRSVGFHIEAFYAYRLSDNITITPGFFILTAPNHDDRNPAVVVGAIRTTFNF